MGAMSFHRTHFFASFSYFLVGEKAENGAFCTLSSERRL